MPGAQVAIDRRPNHVFGGRKGRRLAVTGIKDTLVLRVGAPDADTTASLSELSDSVFGTSGDPVNLRSQYKACSSNQLDFAPVNGMSSSGVQVSNGAYQVSISQTVTGVDNGIVRDAVTAAGNVALGNMQSQYDHVMQCIPPGTNSNWIAYAYINWYLSVYNDNWCTFVSGQMHEVSSSDFISRFLAPAFFFSINVLTYFLLYDFFLIQIGHNLGLAHSGEGSEQYADQSGMMGYSYGSDDGPVMCFNAVKNWQLEWYADRHVLLNAPFSWSGNLYGIADYGTSGSSNKMIVRLVSSTASEDVYVSYNKKTGVNAGTAEGGNQVLIHTKVNGPTEFGQSWLLAKLNAGQSSSVMIDGQSVPIVVNTISNGVASVSIGVPSTPNPSRNPTKFPTNSPTKLPTDVPTKSPLPPTDSPTPNPTSNPTDIPTKSPLPPTDSPTPNPTSNPTKSPTSFPTLTPSTKPPSPILCSSFTSGQICKAQSGCTWSKGFCVSTGSPPSPPSPPSTSPPSPSPPSPSPPTTGPTCSSYTGGGECKSNGCIWETGICKAPAGAVSVASTTQCDKTNILVKTVLQALGDEDCDFKW